MKFSLKGFKSLNLLSIKTYFLKEKNDCGPLPNRGIPPNNLIYYLRILKYFYLGKLLQQLDSRGNVSTIK